jgi:energy-coupling factor transporter ATP-binding protein EcfA2
MADYDSGPYESGSHWRRWNPHIHAPGTLLNDQFEGEWEKYLKAIEDAVPSVEVLGITDYLGIACYKAVRAHHQDGRLPKVKLLFPNVELRLTVETDRRKGINLHLLFCPADGDHIEQIERALSMLSFEYKGRPHRCTEADLVILGRAHNAGLTDEVAARREGANQFKVELPKLRELFRNNKWVADNCIVAVAASNHDGTAGLKNDASFAALRQEIERFAHVIFSSNPKTRDFWLGKSAFDLKKLDLDYGGRKPCLHGCDAHTVAKTCQPDEGRLCWIKGDPSFESLRQTLLEPDERVWIGPTAPDRHDASQCIASVTTRETPWLANSTVPLNPGLVAIIGARGSGKTALADILAIGADVISPLELSSSFIHRATWPVNHLNGAVVQLNWGDGTVIARWLNANQERGAETVRYLSQQFVEQLCSAEGLALELRKEIERVVFDATAPGDRFTAETFEELADIHLMPIRRQRELAKEAIESTSAQVNVEDAMHNRIPTIKKEQEERVKRIEKTATEMKSLIPKDKEERAKRLAALETALATANTAVEKLNRAKMRIDDLRKEVESVRKTTAPHLLTELKEAYEEAGLTAKEWEAFEMVFKGDVDAVLAGRTEAIVKRVRALSEGAPGAVIDLAKDPFHSWPQKQLFSERDKVKKEVGIDGQKQLRFNQLQVRLTADEKAQQKSVEELALAEGAAERRRLLIEKRRSLYVDVFQSYLNEQAVLERLYGTLQKSLEGASGSLKRLRLAVSREIDLNAWVQAGEELLDLRKDSLLRGHGALEGHAERLLTTAWQTGTAEQVGEAMQNFIREMYSEIRKSIPTEITADKDAAWMQQIATWLYSTDHIQMQYSVTYDGVAIEQLSPGTRGIVLLLLYLVIDQQDRRPLIIDQPEENLDPKSVFDELVPHFREARKRRQVIIVTHNANLVVNTDADQVIVATSEPNPSGGLPTVTYRSGSLEQQNVRTTVCEILEGGEQAFRDRERRYRLQRETETVS